MPDMPDLELLRLARLLVQQEREREAFIFSCGFAPAYYPRRSFCVGSKLAALYEHLRGQGLLHCVALEWATARLEDDAESGL